MAAIFDTFIKRGRAHMEGEGTARPMITISTGKANWKEQQQQPQQHAEYNTEQNEY